MTRADKIRQATDHGATIDEAEEMHPTPAATTGGDTGKCYCENLTVRSSCGCYRAGYAAAADQHDTLRRSVKRLVARVKALKE